MKKAGTHSRWYEILLGEIITLEYGSSFPAKKRKRGPYAVYGSNGIIGRADEYFLHEETIIVGRKGSAGEINRAEPNSWPIDTTYYVNIKDARVYSLDFIYYLLKWLNPRRFIDTTTKPGLNRDRVYEQTILLPPLLVQERIVQILQKSDEIRRKRREALETADNILPAVFLNMFGDPDENLWQFDRIPLGDLADVRSGVTKGRKLGGKKTVEVPYLRVANVQDGFLDLSEVKTIDVLPADIDGYHLEDGDILMTEGGDPDKLGRGCVWQNQVQGCIHQNHVFRVRTNRDVLAPGYLAALLRTQYAKHYFLGCAKRSSNLASVNATQVKAFPVPLPPMRFQETFVSSVEQWVRASERQALALKDAERLFGSVMKSAFSGELTAEWEVANAEWIAAQVEMRERLPRLFLLALIRENTVREGRKAAVLLTALMKYAFLVQMEGKSFRRLYHFVPYHYGPFAREVYADLQRLREKGLVRVKGPGGWGDADNRNLFPGVPQAGDDAPSVEKMAEGTQESQKVEISIGNSEAVGKALAELPEDLKEEVSAVVEAYGGMDHNTLLKRVYEKYPAYAEKSRLRKRKLG